RPRSGTPCGRARRAPCADRLCPRSRSTRRPDEEQPPGLAVTRQGPSYAGLSQEGGDDSVGVKILSGERPGRLRVQGVVPANCPDGFGGLLDGTDGKQTLAGGEEIGEAGCLKDDWPASREVAGGAVAEPTAASATIAALHAAELAGRPLDVVA